MKTLTPIRITKAIAPLVAGALLVGCQAAPPADTMSAQAAEDPDKLVCKTEPVTGTRLTRKVCYTQQELEMARQNSREQTEEIQRNSNRPPGG